MNTSDSAQTQAGEFALLQSLSSRVYTALGIAIALVLAGLAAAHYMDVNGHWVTGMNNHVVWGIPHVFAIFLIVSASGCLNVASLSSVFGDQLTKPLARLAVVLAVGLLLAGLGVLILDLGRPERLIVAMTHFNFASVFTWNVFLYSGFVLLSLVYLWSLMSPALRMWRSRIGMFALAWRLVLTSGTGFIFGFLVARDAYDAAILAPLFVTVSLSCGLALFLLCMAMLRTIIGMSVSQPLLQYLARLLLQFVLLAFYVVAVMNIGASYVQEHAGFQNFLLYAGGGYTTGFWIAYMLFGSAVPVILLTTPMRESFAMVVLASALVCMGAFALFYVVIIAGQAYPMGLVPGYVVTSSSFMDGAVAPYTPRLPEILLGLGGLGFAGAFVLLCARVLPLIPISQSSRGLE